MPTEKHSSTPPHPRRHAISDERPTVVGRASPSPLRQNLVTSPRGTGMPDAPTSLGSSPILSWISGTTPTTPSASSSTSSAAAEADLSSSPSFGVVSSASEVGRWSQEEVSLATLKWFRVTSERGTSQVDTESLALSPRPSPMDEAPSGQVNARTSSSGVAVPQVQFALNSRDRYEDEEEVAEHLHMPGRRGQGIAGVLLSVDGTHMAALSTTGGFLASVSSQQGRAGGSVAGEGGGMSQFVGYTPAIAPASPFSRHDVCRDSHGGIIRGGLGARDRPRSLRLASDVISSDSGCEVPLTPFHQRPSGHRSGDVGAVPHLSLAKPLQGQPMPPSFYQASIYWPSKPRREYDELVDAELRKWMAKNKVNNMPLWWMEGSDRRASASTPTERPSALSSRVVAVVGSGVARVAPTSIAQGLRDISTTPAADDRRASCVGGLLPPNVAPVSSATSSRSVSPSSPQRGMTVTPYSTTPRTTTTTLTMNNKRIVASTCPWKYDTPLLLSRWATIRAAADADRLDLSACAAATNRAVPAVGMGVGSESGESASARSTVADVPRSAASMTPQGIATRTGGVEPAVPVGKGSSKWNTVMPWADDLPYEPNTPSPTGESLCGGVAELEAAIFLESAEAFGDGLSVHAPREALRSSRSATRWLAKLFGWQRRRQLATGATRSQELHSSRSTTASMRLLHALVQSTHPDAAHDEVSRRDYRPARTLVGAARNPEGSPNAAIAPPIPVSVLPSTPATRRRPPPPPSARLYNYFQYIYDEHEPYRYILGVAQLLLDPSAVETEEMEMRKYIREVNVLRPHAELPFPFAVQANESSFGPESTAFSQHGSSVALGAPALYAVHDGPDADSTLAVMTPQAVQRQRSLAGREGRSPGVCTPESSAQLDRSSSLFLYSGSVETSAAPPEGRWRADARVSGSTSPLSEDPVDWPRAALDPAEGALPSAAAERSLLNLRPLGERPNGSPPRRVLHRSMEPSSSSSPLPKLQPLPSSVQPTARSTGPLVAPSVDLSQLWLLLHLIQAKRQRHALRLAALKTFSVVLGTFLPIPILVGAAVLPSVVAISGSIIYPIAALLALLTHRLAIRCFHLCFALNRWPGGKAAGGEAAPAAAAAGTGVASAGSCGWLMMTNSLLDLAEQCGGNMLRYLVVVALSGMHVTCCVLLLCMGTTLVGGSVEVHQFLITKSAADVIEDRWDLDSGTEPAVPPQVCTFDSRRYLLSYAPLFVFFLALPSSPLGLLTRLCYWDTQLFRFLTLGLVVGAFTYTVILQQVYVLRRLVAGDTIRLPMIVWTDAVGEGLAWMRDSQSIFLPPSVHVTPGTKGMLLTVVLYILRHFSLSVAGVVWLLVPSIFLIKAGTYHLFLVPLLWRGLTARDVARHAAEDAASAGASAATSTATAAASASDPIADDDNSSDRVETKDADGCAKGDRLPSGPTGTASTSRVGTPRPAFSLLRPLLHLPFHPTLLKLPFDGTGMGFRFRASYAVYVTAALLFALLCLDGSSPGMGAYAAPLPLRLLWTISVAEGVESGPALVHLGNGTTGEDSSTASASRKLCSLGIQSGHPVAVLRMTAFLALLVGLMMFAWVPYFIVSATALLAHLRRDSGSREACHGTPVPPAVLAPRSWSWPWSWACTWGGGPRRWYHRPTPAGATTPGSSPVHQLHGDRGRAALKVGSTLHIFQYFQSLRQPRSEQYHSAVIAFAAEFLLLRIPVYFLTLLLSALVLSGRTARCMSYWLSWDIHHPKVPSHPHGLGGGGSATPAATETVDFCTDISTAVSSGLFGRVFLVAALGGGLFVAPILFHVMPLMLWRDAWQRWKLHLERLATASTLVTATPVGAASATSPAAEQPRRAPQLTPSDAVMGVEGIQHFIGLQRLGRGSGGPDHRGCRRGVTDTRGGAVPHEAHSRPSRWPSWIPNVTHLTPATVVMRQQLLRAVDVISTAEAAVKECHRVVCSIQQDLLQRQHAGTVPEARAVNGPIRRSSDEDLQEPLLDPGGCVSIELGISEASAVPGAVEGEWPPPLPQAVGRHAQQQLHAATTRLHRARWWLWWVTRWEQAMFTLRAVTFVAMMILAHGVGLVAVTGALRAADALFLQLRTRRDYAAPRPLDSP